MHPCPAKGPCPTRVEQFTRTGKFVPDPISGPTLIASKMDSNPMFAPLITRAIYAGTQPIDAKGMAVTRQISLRLLLVLVLLFGLALMFAGMAIPT